MNLGQENVRDSPALDISPTSRCSCVAGKQVPRSYTSQSGTHSKMSRKIKIFLFPRMYNKTISPTEHEAFLKHIPGLAFR